MSTSLGKQISVPRICDPTCLEKLRVLLSQYFIIQEEYNIPSHMKLKARLERTGLPREVHLELYTNNNTEIKASSEIRPFFDAICTQIENILREAINMLSNQNVVRVTRAKRIKEYMEKIPIEPEVDRMVTVTLCDIILDLFVTEKLSQFTHERRDLENESIGAKLSLLEEKYHIPIYKPKAIRDIRELRNKIAHGGVSTAKDEALFARNTTIKIFELF